MTAAGLTIVEAAIQYIEAGVSIYPVGSNKKPLITGWNNKGAICDPDVAKRYFEQEFPAANIGIAIGPSRLFVIDIDRRNGGELSWRKLVAEVGLETFEAVPTVETPGGFHLYFSNNPEIKAKSGALGPGIDLLGGRSGVIAPPSRRGPSKYTWRTPSGFFDEFEPPRLPEALMARIRSAAKESLLDALPDKILPGFRNSFLTQYAGRVRWRLGLSSSSLNIILQDANAERCQPPLPESEVRMIAESISKRDPVEVPDGMWWLQQWLPHFRAPSDARLALALAIIQDQTCVTMTPSEALVLATSGMSHDAYIDARRRLIELGCIEVKSRGNLSPVIKLVLRTRNAA